MFLRFFVKPQPCNNNIKRLFSVEGSLNRSETSNIVTSVVPPINIPELFLDSYIWKNLDKWENKIAVECAETGRSYRYLEVYNKSRALSNFLHKIPRLTQKDTLAIILPNVPEFPIILLGIIQAGFKATTVNSNYKSDEISRQLLHSETKFVFTTNQLWPQVNQAILQLPTDIPIAVVKKQTDESLPPGTIDFHEILEGNFDCSYHLDRSIDDVILLPYSSGTTGLPKGVQLSHRNIVSNLYQMDAKPFKMLEDAEGTFQEILPVVLPLFHLYGLAVVLLNGLARGSKLVTIPKFQSEPFIRLLEVHKPTVCYCAPPIVLFLLNNKNVQPEHLCTMKTIISAAAPLGASDIYRLREKGKGKINILQMYGLTETSPVTHSQTALFENGVKVGGSGFSLPNTETMIMALDSNDNVGLGANVSGEIVIRGPQVTKGYYKNEKATKASFNSNGWFKTGDIGFVDEFGHLFVTDRLKELIRVKGFQVAPAELEELLRTHPGIEDAAVIGVPHPWNGEAPKAFIVPKKDTKINIYQVQEYVASKVAHFKQLEGGVTILDSIPKSAAGKILRRQLKDYSN